MFARFCWAIASWAWELFAIASWVGGFVVTGMERFVDSFTLSNSCFMFNSNYVKFFKKGFNHEGRSFTLKIGDLKLEFHIGNWKTKWKNNIKIGNSKAKDFLVRKL